VRERAFEQDGGIDQQKFMPPPKRKKEDVMGRMFGDKLIKEERMVVKVTDEGIILSDLHLAGMVLACIEGTACYQTMPREGSNTRFLFYIKGDKAKISEFIEYWFSGDKKHVNEIIQKRSEELRKYGNIISMLKALLDKSRADTNKSAPPVKQEPVVQKEPVTQKPAEEKKKDVVDKN